MRAAIGNRVCVELLLLLLLCAVLPLLALGASALGSHRVAGVGTVVRNAKANFVDNVETGPCTSNDNEIEHYGATMASSPTLLAVGGTDGQADVQCIVQACADASDLVFVWNGEFDSGRQTRRAKRAVTSTAAFDSIAAFPRALAEGERGAHPEQAAVATPAGQRGVMPARKLLVKPSSPEKDLSLPDGGVRATSNFSLEEFSNGARETVQSARLAEPDGIDEVTPRCERGGWSPSTPGSVQLAMKGNLVVFGAAGCAEMHFLDAALRWQHIASLPSSLNVSATRADGVGREWLPLLRADLFAQQLAVDDNVLAVTGALSSPSAPNVVIMFGLVGVVWGQVDVVQCPDCHCSGSDLGARKGCYGSSLAVSDSLLAVGYPNNGSVLLYSRHLVGPPGQGLSLRWMLRQVLTNSWQTEGRSGFGTALAMSSSLVVIGGPGSDVGGAVVVSLNRNTSAAYPMGDVVFDARQACCDNNMACCTSRLFGEAVAVAESDKTGFKQQATVAICDPDSTAGRIPECPVISCDVAQLDFADDGQSPCTFSAVVLPGYTRDWTSRVSGFGKAVGVGGYQAVLVADASVECDYGEDGCGLVCEVAGCSPGHCRMYDFSTDADFCQKCGRAVECPGGIQSCPQAGGDTLWAMALSLLFFMLLFMGLYALSAWARGASIWEILGEACCCGLLRYLAGLPMVRTHFPDLEQALLGVDAGAAGAGEEEDTDDDELDGYVPKTLREAFRARQQESVIAPGAVGEVRHRDEEASQEGGTQDGPASGEVGEGHGNDDEDIEPESGGLSGNTLGEVQRGANEDANMAGSATNGPSGLAVQGEVEVQPSLSDVTCGDRMETEDEGDGCQRTHEAATAVEMEEGTVGVSIAYFQCKICFERRIQTVLVPCGHEVLCRKCSKKIKTCPICRKVVKSVVDAKTVVE